MIISEKFSARCSHCREDSTLVLVVEAREEFTARIGERVPGQEVPTFDVELDDDSVINYVPYLKCSKCKMRSGLINHQMEYDEISDRVTIPAYEDFMKREGQGPLFASGVVGDEFTPEAKVEEKKEEDLPDIVRPSNGESMPEVIGPIPHMGEVLDNDAEGFMHGMRGMWDY